MALNPSLNAFSRQIRGKKTKHLRKRGRIPAVVYGYEVKNQSVECAEQEFHKVFVKAGESTVVDLTIDKKKVPVLIHHLTCDPVTGQYAHIDFLAIDLTKEVTTHVPLRMIGVAPGVTELGGVLVHPRETLTVRCLPKDLPHAIDVDISSLKNFHDAVTVAALTLPPNVKVAEKAEEILVSLQPPRKEEEVAPVVAEAATAEGAAAAGAPVAEGADASEKKGAPEATKAAPKKEKKGEK